MHAFFQPRKPKSTNTGESTLASASVAKDGNDNKSITTTTTSDNDEKENTVATTATPTVAVTTIASSQAISKPVQNATGMHHVFPN